MGMGCCILEITGQYCRIKLDPFYSINNFILGMDADHWIQNVFQMKTALLRKASICYVT